MPHFSAIKAVFYSVFSPDLYRDVFLRWQGVGFGYLLLLNMLVITPVIFYLVLSIERNIFPDAANLSPELQALIDEVVPQIPPMVFENGELTTKASQPHLIYITSEGKKTLFAQIYLKGGLNELRDSESVLLLSSEAVHAKLGDGKIETHYWRDMGQQRFELNEELAREWANRGVAWLAENKSWLMALFGVLAWVGTLLVMFIYRAFQAFTFGLAALLVAKVMRFSLRYGDAVRLSCLAMTPPILLDMVFGLALQDRMSVLIFVLVTVAYLVFAIKSLRQLG